MKRHAALSVVAAALVAVSAAQVDASVVNLSIADNLAPSATVTGRNDLWSASISPLTALVDSKVSDGVPGEASFEEAYHAYFDTVANPGWVELAWTAPKNLTSLQTYVCQGDAGAAVDADRIVSAVQFYVNQGSGFTSVGTVNTVDTDDIGGFDLTKIDGSWSNVTAVRYEFTGNGAQGGRVAEVIAIGTAVPEPSTVTLIGAGLLSLLAYAWRKRR